VLVLPSIPLGTFALAQRLIRLQLLPTAYLEKSDDLEPFFKVRACAVSLSISSFGLAPLLILVQIFSLYRYGG
jgi:hypothetical protein